MFRRHVLHRLSAFNDGQLQAREAAFVAAHLERCTKCRAGLDEIRFGNELARRLPLAEAPAGIWNEVQAALDRPRPARKFAPVWAVAVTAALVLAAALGWYFTRPRGSWELAWEGAGTARLAVGQWLETGTRRAKITVGRIGEVEVEPHTRIRLLQARVTDHRLALARGTLRARIWAPPRLFFVETPSATAIDLGCAYTLKVDDSGDGLLHVTHGWVALEDKGRESIVPEGALCRTRSGFGPGTPFFEDASGALKEALQRFDFENGGAAALQTVVLEARDRDTLTLWHLLPRTGETDRAFVYGRIAALIDLPRSISREDVLRLDRSALDALKADLEYFW